MTSPETSLTADRLRTIVQDAHLHFLIGAGTSSPYFSLLGDIEMALAAIDESDSITDAKALARASVRAHFFDRVIAPNVALLDRETHAQGLLRSYGDFGRTLNRVLIARRNSLLSKKINLFTTNIDLAIEVAFERLGIDLIDGFAGRIRPAYDLGLLGSLHYRTGPRYEHRSEIPTFDLYKLHGSVGWRLTDDPATPSGITFDQRLSDLAAIASLLDPLRRHLIPIEDSGDIDVDHLLAVATASTPEPGLADFTSAYDSLVIVNPETQKFATTVLTETYYELIRRFANALERENSLLIVHGFSFRDDHLRNLVLRCARTNPTLQVLIACYDDAAHTSYRTLIPPTQVPNGNITFLTAPDDTAPLDLNMLTHTYLAPLATNPSETPDIDIDDLLAPAAP